MILSFRNRALKRYWENSDDKGLNRQHVARIGRILDALDRAISVIDMAVPGYKPHKLEVGKPERWSVWVNGNWRISFSFEDGDAFAIDYEDYH